MGLGGHKGQREPGVTGTGVVIGSVLGHPGGQLIPGIQSGHLACRLM